MSYLNPNAGPDEFTQVTKEVCRVKTAGTNTVTKGDLVPILPYAPDQDLSRGGWRFAVSPAANQGGERIWGVALEDAGNNEYFRCQIAGVCRVNAVGKLSDAVTPSSSGSGLVQGTALTCDMSGSITSSSAAYEAVTDDAILCVVLYGAQDIVAQNATGQTTVLLAGPTFPHRSL